MEIFKSQIDGAYYYQTPGCGCCSERVRVTLKNIDECIEDIEDELAYAKALKVKLSEAAQPSPPALA